MSVGLFQKVLGLNLGLALAVLLISSSVFALSAHRLLVNGLGEEAVQIAEEAVSTLEPAQVEPLLVRQAHSQSLWRSLVDQLGEIQAELGRRGVENVYILAPRPGGIFVLADPTGEDTAFAVLDTVYTGLKSEVLREGQARATPDPYTDEWGTWISGYVPIHDAKGVPMAILGIDLPLGAFPVMRKIIARTMILSAVPAALLALLASYFLSGRLTGPARALTGALREVRSGRLDVEVRVESSDEFGEMAEAFNDMTVGLAEKERMRSMLVQSVSREVADKLLSGEIAIRGEVREVSVLFSDIRNFTELSETLSARSVIELLNAYFDALLPCVEARGGIIDKLVGDEIMAVFGAPLELKDDALAAVLTALDMRAALAAFNRVREAEGEPTVAMGVGISTGTVVAGGLGSESRRNYTVLGTTVNVGARLCSAALANQILISEATYLRTKKSIEAQQLEPLDVKGITFPLNVFEVLRSAHGNGKVDHA